MIVNELNVDEYLFNITQVIEASKRKYANLEVVFGGDFNNKDFTSIESLMQNLLQRVNFPTREEAILDLLFTSITPKSISPFLPLTNDYEAIGKPSDHRTVINLRQ